MHVAGQVADAQREDDRLRMSVFALRLEYILFIGIKYAV
jgi:hypothetical protein